MKKILLFLLPLLGIISTHAQQVTLDNNLVIERRDVSYYDDNGEYIEKYAAGVVNGKDCVGDIEIPATVEIEGVEYPVEYIYDSAFNNNGLLTSINGCENIKEIHSYAFEFCTNLISVCDLPKVSHLEYYSFGYCYGLTNVGNLPLIKNIQDNTFFMCRNLETIGLDGIETIGNWAFWDCNKLKSIGDLSNLTTIGREGLMGCYVLEGTIDLSKLNSVSIQSFAQCQNLKFKGKPVNLSSFPDGLFSECKNLTEIDLSNITGIGSRALSETSISVIDLTSITMIGDAALAGTKIKTADLRNFTSLPNSLFNGCKELEYLDLSSIKTIGEETFNNTFATLIFTSTTPCTIDKSFCANNTIIVPSEALQTYREAWSDYEWQIIGADHQKTNHEVIVEANPGDSDLRNKLLAAGVYRDFSDVMKLKVTGTINGYDMQILRNKMINLHELDLSDASIVDCDNYEYYQGYHSTNNVLGPCFFKDILPLRKIKLPNTITTIGSEAFENCSNLEEVIFGKDLEIIESSAFYQTNIKSIVFPDKLREIRSSAFSDCSSLKTIEFPRNLNIIYDNAFSSCYSLEEVNLPIMLRTLGYGSFQRCSQIRSIRIPEAIQWIGDGAFQGCNKIGYIKTYTVLPTNINQNTFDRAIYNTANLDVPKQGENYYYWGTQWSQFVKMDTFNEPYSYFYVPDDQDLVLEDGNRFNQDEEGNPLLDDEGNPIETKPDVDIQDGAGIVFEGDQEQELGTVTVGESSSIITSGASVVLGVRIEDLNINIEIVADRWYFFAFPFDIDFSDIKFNGQYVWRHYDSEVRAQSGAGAWRNVSGKLEAYKGYIFQANKGGTLTLNIKNVYLFGGERMLALEGYDSTYPENANWNLIGNPYSCYFNIQDLDATTPITIWDSDTQSYKAYSPEDDDYFIYPYQAFFMQKDSNMDGLRFESDGRTTQYNITHQNSSQQNARMRRAARRGPAATSRELINIELVCGNFTDNTRVVFNPSSSEEYETSCDASKFMSDNVPQIYTLGSRNTRYAINERPEADGTVRLGLTIPSSGVFTIKASRVDCPMIIRDLATGKEAALDENGYSFTCSEGIHDGRFILVKGTPTGLNEIDSENNGQATYYGVDGITYGNDLKNAPQGTIVIKGHNGHTTKVLNK